MALSWKCDYSDQSKVIICLVLKKKNYNIKGKMEHIVKTYCKGVLISMYIISIVIRSKEVET